MFRQVLTPSLRILGSRSTRLGLTRKTHSSQHRGPHMDDLPVPSGSWSEHFKENQSKYNLNLALAAVFFAITVVTAKVSGLVYLNYYPPKLPED